MQNGYARAYQAIAAGAIAGLIQWVIILIAANTGLLDLLGLDLEFPLEKFVFYQRFSWGGLWGLLFLLPLMPKSAQWLRGLALGVIPALASLFFFLPFSNDKGFLGLDLGLMMPVVVLFFGLVWGVIAGKLLSRAGLEEESA